MITFYALEPGGGKRFGTKWAYADPLEPMLFDIWQKCPNCGKPVSMRKWLPPHNVKLSSAKPAKWGDFVWGSFEYFLVSERFKLIYEKEGLTGISEFSHPVNIVRMGTLKSGEFPQMPPAYYFIRVPWGGANQDDEASLLVHRRPERITCSYCRVGVSARKQEKVILEPGSWDRTDLFRPRGAPVNLLASERFKNIVEEYELKNCWLIPAEKYGYDEQRPGLWYVNENE